MNIVYRLVDINLCLTCTYVYAHVCVSCRIHTHQSFRECRRLPYVFINKFWNFVCVSPNAVVA